MKTILMMAAAFMLSTSAFANVNPENGETAEKVATTTVTMTIGELKAIYGAENVEIEGSAEITDQTMVSFTRVNGGPCGGEQPCGAALAQARHASQQLANECCCIQTNGVECCDNGTFKAILFIVVPKSPHCN